jgi:uncharacterized protein YjiS (DUF1127 family)
MKIDQNIIQLHQRAANPLAQLRNYQAKAHRLRSEAFVSLASRFIRFISHLPNRLRQYRASRRLYRELVLLDDRLLRDIGLSRNDLYRIQQGMEGLQALQQEREAVYGRDISVQQVDNHHDPVTSEVRAAC